LIKLSWLLGLHEVAGGWDNRMRRLGEYLAVRLPRTPRAPSVLIVTNGA